MEDELKTVDLRLRLFIMTGTAMMTQSSKMQPITQGLTPISWRQYHVL